MCVCVCVCGYMYVCIYKGEFDCTRQVQVYCHLQERDIYILDKDRDIYGYRYRYVASGLIDSLLTASFVLAALVRKKLRLREDAQIY